MAESETSRSTRERLYAVIEETGSTDDQLAGTVLVGFMVVAEWRGPGGEQWLSKVSGDHAGSLPTWRQRGYAAEIVHDMWGDTDPDRDDDGGGGDGG